MTDTLGWSKLPGIGSRTARNVCYMICAQATDKIITFVSGILLMRLLSPVDFGVVGLGFLIIGVVNLIAESGIGVAAIQLPSSDDRRMVSTAFWGRLLSGAIFFVIAAGGSTLMVRPFVNFGVPQSVLRDVIGSLSVLILFDSIGFYPRVMLQRQLRFGPVAVAQSLSAAVYAMCALFLVHRGFSYWSLVDALVIARGCSASVLWVLYRRELPLICWEWRALWEMLEYGRQVIGIMILSVLTTKIDDFVVGRMFGAQALGYYLVAWSWSRWTDVNVAHVVSRVLFPTLAKIREDAERLRLFLEKTTFYVYAFALPIAGVLILFVSDIVRLILGSDWEGISLPVRILSITGIIAPCVNIYGQCLMAKGRPDLVWRYTSLHFLVFLAILYPAARLGGLQGVCWADALGGVFVMTVLYRICRTAFGFEAAFVLRPFAAPIGSFVGATSVTFLLKSLQPASDHLTFVWQVGGYLAIFAILLNALSGGQVFRGGQSLLRAVLSIDRPPVTPR